MTTYNFDEVINRENTNSIKYAKALFNKPADIIPMWVADMDFKTVPQVSEVLKKRAQYGVFGYTDTPPAYDAALYNWYKKRFDWAVMPGWNIQAPGVLFAVTAAIRALTVKGDPVFIFQPVYHPFERIIKGLQRLPVINELKLINGKYEIDFDLFEKTILADKVKVLLFCSPHNPIGKVWSKEELLKLGEICLKHGVRIISDEIHADLVFKDHKHTVLASLNEDIADITITCVAPTKTFNLAGLQAANTFIKNAEVRNLVRKECELTAYHHLNTMGADAALAAYTYGEPWLDSLLDYLKDNASLLDKTLKEINGGIKLIKPQGTYLMWLDCRALGLTDAALNAFFTEKAKLWLNEGTIFGKGGSGFMRMNIACPRITMNKALDNLKNALSTL